MSSSFQFYIRVLNGLRLSYSGTLFKKVLIEATNPITGDTYKKIVKARQEFHVNIHYLTNWKIKMYGLISTGNRNAVQTFRKKVVDIELNYKDTNVAFKFATEALGDTLCWVPVIEEWVIRNQPKRAYLWTKWNHIFDKSKYPKNIIWVDDLNEFKTINHQAFHTVGISKLHANIENSKTNHATSVNWKDCDLINTQNYSFGLPLEERLPKLITIPDQRPMAEPYVSLCISSSQKIKHWLNPKGWMALVRALHSVGLKVVTVGNVPNILPEVVDAIGSDIRQAMHIIKHAEFHIGLTSGLSWVAWALNKPVLMIGDFTSPHYEFKNNLIRMFSDNEQSGVFNRLDIPWEPRYEYDPFKDNLKIARDLDVSHALHCLKVLLNKVQQGGNFPGIYITPDRKEHPINNLEPRVRPLIYR